MPYARLRTFARLGAVAAMLAAPPLALQVPTVRRLVFALADAMQHGGASGLALYAAFVAAASLLTVPVWILGGLAGFAYGFPYGVFAAVPALCLGGTCAFLVGRALATTSLGAALRGWGRFRQIELVVRHDGARVAALLRLAPMMPQNLLHYALGATPMRARDFALSTGVGLLPAVAVQVYVGSLVRDASGLFRSGAASLRDPLTWLKLGGGLALTVAGLALAMRYARRALAASIAKAERDAASSPEASSPETPLVPHPGGSDGSSMGRDGRP